jgi:hypothetical protein
MYYFPFFLLLLYFCAAKVVQLYETHNPYLCGFLYQKRQIDAD